MRLSKKFAAIAITATVALTATAAFAFWTGGGTGPGSAGTASSTGVTVNQTSAPGVGLRPGGSVGLAGNFTNSNPGDVAVASVTANVNTFSVQTDPLKPACTQADYSIGGTAAGSLVAPGTGGSWSGLSLIMANGAFNQDNCQGHLVAITYSANAI